MLKLVDEKTILIKSSEEFDYKNYQVEKIIFEAENNCFAQFKNAFQFVFDFVPS